VASSTTKQVYVRRFDEALMAGYVNPKTYLRPEGLELLDREAQLHLLPYRSIKIVYFVRDFDEASIAEAKTAFQSRPKSGGLWIELEFRDGDSLECLLNNDLLQVGVHGITAMPPDSKSSAQLVFVPRDALEGVKVHGVIGRPARAAGRREPARDQRTLFNQPAPR
jgi:hypothetical protein